MALASVFGASNASEALYHTSVVLGRYLAQKNYIVQCGGYQGVMEGVARGAFESGGKTVGVTLAEFDQSRPENPYLTQKIQAVDIFERLRYLINDVDLIIVMPGRIGTLNELLMVWCMVYADLIKAPKICLIGTQWGELHHLKTIIPQEQFSYIQFFDTVDCFIKEFKEFEMV